MRRARTELNMRSPARTNVPEATGELNTEEIESFPVWEVFTQKKRNDAHQHAGSLSAPDAMMAQYFAREHYGQDQECVNMWIGERRSFTSDCSAEETYEVFVQWSAGDRHVHVGDVNAKNSAEAREKCTTQFTCEKPYFTIWAVPVSALTKIDSSTDMIWRESTDQAYRLARGYSKIVRQKWEAIRAKQAVDKYQEEDLKETF